MAWTDDPYASTRVVTADMQKIEDNLIALKVRFAGPTPPTTIYQGMLWFNTTDSIMRMFKSSNTAYGLIPSDGASQKFWVYKNTVHDGFTLDTSVVDAVLAIRGGATYTAGGILAGTWFVSGHGHGTNLASHVIRDSENAPHTHPMALLSGTNDSHGFQGTNSATKTCGEAAGLLDMKGSASPAGHTHTIADSVAGSTDRLYAAVGTMQYPTNTCTVA